MKARADARQGVAQQETAEDDALVARWKSLIETQTAVLIEPLRDELSKVKSEVAGLRLELDQSRRKYWAAISHIRTLYTWIARHLPPDVEATSVPEPPAMVAEDV